MSIWSYTVVHIYRSVGEPYNCDELFYLHDGKGFQQLVIFKFSKWNNTFYNWL